MVRKYYFIGLKKIYIIDILILGSGSSGSHEEFNGSATSTTEKIPHHINNYKSQ